MSVRPGSPLPDTYSLLFDVFALGQEVRRLLTEAMRDGPLRPEEYAVASVVFEEETASPTVMAARLSVPLTTAVEYIRTLEVRGLLTRIANPLDGRSHLLVLTATGLEAHREANRRFEAAYGRVIAALALPEDETRRALRGLRAAVRAAAPDANPTHASARHR